MNHLTHGILPSAVTGKFYLMKCVPLTKPYYIEQVHSTQANVESKNVPPLTRVVANKTQNACDKHVFHLAEIFFTPVNVPFKPLRL